MFNSYVTIKFALLIAGNVKINVYNPIGQLVETLVEGQCNPVITKLILMVQNWQAELICISYKQVNMYQ